MFLVKTMVHKTTHTGEWEHKKFPITNESGLNPKQPSNRLSKSLLHTIPSQLQFSVWPLTRSCSVSLIFSKLVVLSGSYTIHKYRVRRSLFAVFSWQMSNVFQCGRYSVLNGKWPRVSLFIFSSSSHSYSLFCLYLCVGEKS